MGGCSKILKVEGVVRLNVNCKHNSSSLTLATEAHYCSTKPPPVLSVICPISPVSGHSGRARLSVLYIYILLNRD